MFYDFIYLAEGFRMRPKVRSTLRPCMGVGMELHKIWTSIYHHTKHEPNPPKGLEIMRSYKL